MEQLEFESDEKCVMKTDCVDSHQSEQSMFPSITSRFRNMSLESSYLPITHDNLMQPNENVLENLYSSLSTENILDKCMYEDAECLESIGTFDMFSSDFSSYESFSQNYNLSDQTNVNCVNIDNNKTIFECDKLDEEQEPIKSDSVIGENETDKLYLDIDKIDYNFLLRECCDDTFLAEDGICHLNNCHLTWSLLKHGIVKYILTPSDFENCPSEICKCCILPCNSDVPQIVFDCDSVNSHRRFTYNSESENICPGGCGNSRPCKKYTDHKNSEKEETIASFSKKCDGKTACIECSTILFDIESAWYEMKIFTLWLYWALEKKIEDLSQLAIGFRVPCNCCHCMYDKFSKSNSELFQNQRLKKSNVSKGSFDYAYQAEKDDLLSNMETEIASESNEYPADSFTCNRHSLLKDDDKDGRNIQVELNKFLSVQSGDCCCNLEVESRNRNKNNYIIFICSKTDEVRPIYVDLLSGFELNEYNIEKKVGTCADTFYNETWKLWKELKTEEISCGVQSSCKECNCTCIKPKFYTFSQMASRIKGIIDNFTRVSMTFIVYKMDDLYAALCARYSARLVTLLDAGCDFTFLIELTNVIHIFKDAETWFNYILGPNRIRIISILFTVLPSLQFMKNIYSWADSPAFDVFLQVCEMLHYNKVFPLTWKDALIDYIDMLQYVHDADILYDIEEKLTSNNTEDKDRDLIEVYSTYFTISKKICDNFNKERVQNVVKCNDSLFTGNKAAKKFYSIISKEISLNKSEVDISFNSWNGWKNFEKLTICAMIKAYATNDHISNKLLQHILQKVINRCNFNTQYFDNMNVIDNSQEPLNILVESTKIYHPKLFYLKDLLKKNKKSLKDKYSNTEFNEMILKELAEIINCKLSKSCRKIWLKLAAGSFINSEKYSFWNPEDENMIRHEDTNYCAYLEYRRKFTDHFFGCLELSHSIDYSFVKPKSVLVPDILNCFQTKLWSDFYKITFFGGNFLERDEFQYFHTNKKTFSFSVLSRQTSEKYNTLEQINSNFDYDHDHNINPLEKVIISSNDETVKMNGNVISINKMFVIIGFIFKYESFKNYLGESFSKSLDNDLSDLMCKNDYMSKVNCKHFEKCSDSNNNCFYHNLYSVIEDKEKGNIRYFFKEYMAKEKYKNLLCSTNKNPEIKDSVFNIELLFVFKYLLNLNGDMNSLLKYLNILSKDDANSKDFLNNVNFRIVDNNYLWDPMKGDVENELIKLAKKVKTEKEIEKQLFHFCFQSIIIKMLIDLFPFEKNILSKTNREVFEKLDENLDKPEQKTLSNCYPINDYWEKINSKLTGWRNVAIKIFYHVVKLNLSNQKNKANTHNQQGEKKFKQNLKKLDALKISVENSTDDFYKKVVEAVGIFHQECDSQRINGLSETESVCENGNTKIADKIIGRKNQNNHDYESGVIKKQIENVSATLNLEPINKICSKSIKDKIENYKNHFEECNEKKISSATKLNTYSVIKKSVSKSNSFSAKKTLKNNFLNINSNNSGETTLNGIKNASLNEGPTVLSQCLRDENVKITQTESQKNVEPLCSEKSDKLKAGSIELTHEFEHIKIPKYKSKKNISKLQSSILKQTNDKKLVLKNKNPIKDQSSCENMHKISDEKRIINSQNNTQNVNLKNQVSIDPKTSTVQTNNTLAAKSLNVISKKKKLESVNPQLEKSQDNTQKIHQRQSVTNENDRAMYSSRMTQTSEISRDSSLCTSSICSRCSDNKMHKQDTRDINSLIKFIEEPSCGTSKVKKQAKKARQKIKKLETKMLEERDVLHESLITMAGETSKLHEEVIRLKKGLSSAYHCLPLATKNKQNGTKNDNTNIQNHERVLLLQQAAQEASARATKAANLAEHAKIQIRHVESTLNLLSSSVSKACVKQKSEEKPILNQVDLFQQKNKNKHETYSCGENMVTIKRVIKPNCDEPSVTITTKSKEVSYAKQDDSIDIDPMKRKQTKKTALSWEAKIAQMNALAQSKKTKTSQCNKSNTVNKNEAKKSKPQPQKEKNKNNAVNNSNRGSEKNKNNKIKKSEEVTKNKVNTSNKIKHEQNKIECVQNMKEITLNPKNDGKKKKKATQSENEKKSNTRDSGVSQQKSGTNQLIEKRNTKVKTIKEFEPSKTAINENKSNKKKDIQKNNSNTEKDKNCLRPVVNPVINSQIDPQICIVNSLSATMDKIKLNDDTTIELASSVKKSDSHNFTIHDNKNAPVASSIVEQLKSGIQFADLKLPPGITLTRVDPSKQPHNTPKPNIPLVTSTTPAAYRPTPPVAPPPAVIMVDTTKLHADREIKTQNNPQLDNLKSKSKKSKKKPNKLPTTNNAETPMTGHSDESSKMVTLRNPMFHSAFQVPPALHSPAKSLTDVRIPESIQIPSNVSCQATITPTSNGMYTIRNPLMSIVHQQGMMGMNPLENATKPLLLVANQHLKTAQTQQSTTTDCESTPKKSKKNKKNNTKESLKNVTDQLGKLNLEKIESHKVVNKNDSNESDNNRDKMGKHIKTSLGTSTLVSLNSHKEASFDLQSPKSFPKPIGTPYAHEIKNLEETRLEENLPIQNFDNCELSKLYTPFATSDNDTSFGSLLFQPYVRSNQTISYSQSGNNNCTIENKMLESPNLYTTPSASELSMNPLVYKFQNLHETSPDILDNSKQWNVTKPLIQTNHEFYSNQHHSNSSSIIESPCIYTTSNTNYNTMHNNYIPPADLTTNYMNASLYNAHSIQFSYTSDHNINTMLHTPSSQISIKQNDINLTYNGNVTPIMTSGFSESSKDTINDDSKLLNDYLSNNYQIMDFNEKENRSAANFSQFKSSVNLFDVQNPISNFKADEEDLTDGRNVFAPNQSIKNLNELESSERDIETFKRFDFYFEPPKNKPKINLNVQDIALQRIALAKLANSKEK